MTLVEVKALESKVLSCRTPQGGVKDTAGEVRESDEVSRGASRARVGQLLRRLGDAAMCCIDLDLIRPPLRRFLQEPRARNPLRRLGRAVIIEGPFPACIKLT